MMTSESNRPFFIAVCTEVICELDPLTIAELFDELDDQWTLIDGLANVHEVEFNKSMLMPIIIRGWDKFRNYYNITSNPLMSFTYVGNSIFLIKLFNGSTPNNEYPRYHTLTTSCLKDLTFEVDMPDTSPITSKLILPPAFGIFFQTINHEYLRVCGGSNTITICKLVFKKDVKSNTRTVIITRGWRSFCFHNDISPKSLLQFKCDSIMAKNIIFVQKVYRRY
ncbi:uncharacterized protein [Medicago truncatula]|nr:uncharacterized protein LOC112421764 [Medicago truncatula]